MCSCSWCRKNGGRESHFGIAGTWYFVDISWNAYNAAGVFDNLVFCKKCGLPTIEIDGFYLLSSSSTALPFSKKIEWNYGLSSLELERF